ncbi:MAG: ShlB/FhaC/HecB family hemolysin secretion/activation protein [Methylophagaceae bacterium]
MTVVNQSRTNIFVYNYLWIIRLCRNSECFYIAYLSILLLISNSANADDYSVLKDSNAIASFKSLNVVVIKGGTVFNEGTLDGITQAYIGRRIDSVMVESMRQKINQYYLKQGYLNSGVIVEDINYQTGEVSLRVVEGRLSAITFSGQGRLPKRYLKQRLWNDDRQIFNIQLLRERIQVLLDDPMIDKVDGDLEPGDALGQAKLNMVITRSKPYQLSFGFDNQGSVSAGELRANSRAIIYTPLGLGDQLDLELVGSKGGFQGKVNYRIPIGNHQAYIELGYIKGDSDIIEAPFDRIDISSKSDRFDLSYWQALDSIPLTLGIGFSISQTKNFLLDQPFSFSPGEEDGRSKISALRLTQNYSIRNNSSALSATSTVSVGLKVFNATDHNSSTRPDSSFLSWRSAFSYLHQYEKQNISLVINTSFQLAGSSLLPAERFSLGGANLRAYRLNSLVRDQGVSATAELNYRMKTNDLYGEFIPSIFVDTGLAWDYKEFNAKEDLTAIGIGLKWKYADRIQMNLSWAKALNSRQDNSSLQDRGIYFHLNWRL